MTASEEFKQAIRAGNISEAFVVAMSNAPELNITTKIVTADGNKVDVDSEVKDNYLRTHINLIEGKVENEIGEKLTGDRYSEIKQFHIQQVTQGHQTIQHNLISLQKMFQLMSAFQNQEANANWVDIAADVSHESISASSPNQLGSNATNVLSPSQRLPRATSTGPALTVGKATEEKADSSISNLDRDHAEPQLPSFDGSDEAMNELLSLVDVDDSDTQPTTASENQADWSEWLDDEPDVQTKVFDLKSLKVENAQENWHNWKEQNEAADTDSDKT